MEKMTFYIVDVFAEEKYSGNQLAVVCADVGLSSLLMQKIAREINYSETTFIFPAAANENGYDLRIFTPTAEVPFAGHPVIGTAFVVLQEIEQKKVEGIEFNLKAGQIGVNVSYNDSGVADVLWMKHPIPVFREQAGIEDISNVLQIDKVFIDSRFPVEDVSTGFPFLIVPLTSLEAVRSVNINKDAYLKFIEKREAKAILVFSTETYKPENDLNVRVFCDYYGIPEDPATGSANGCLAAWLVKNKYFGSENVDLKIEQGIEMGRASLLFIKGGRAADGSIDVSVGGRSVLVAKGELPG